MKRWIKHHWNRLVCLVRGHDWVPSASRGWRRCKRCHDYKEDRL